MPTQEAVEVDWRRLVHRLNQRYREEFDRAERLQSQLDHIRGSRAWRILCWWCRIKRWLWPMREADRFLRESREEFATCIPSQVSGTVSILIPFRDRVELLRNALAGLRRTSYRKFEIILIDNGSTASRTLRLLNRLQGRRRIRIVKCPGAFNFSRLCNRGAGRARGDYLLFLNNDIEVGEPDWLERMLQVARDPGVGVVGATLLYPDGTLQHAGIFPAASGEWRHAYRGLPGDRERRDPHVVPDGQGRVIAVGAGEG